MNSLALVIYFMIAFVKKNKCQLEMQGITGDDTLPRLWRIDVHSSLLK